MTITEFLLARIAEDEASAGSWYEDWGGNMEPLQSRALAECKAKRQIIEDCWEAEERIEGEWGSCRSREELDATGYPPPALKAMSTVYADHPDYRQEWAL